MTKVSAAAETFVGPLTVTTDGRSVVGLEWLLHRGGRPLGPHPLGSGLTGLGTHIAPGVRQLPLEVE